MFTINHWINQIDPAIIRLLLNKIHVNKNHVFFEMPYALFEMQGVLKYRLV